MQSETTVIVIDEKFVCPRCTKSVSLADTVELPDGRLCDDCFVWINDLLEEAETVLMVDAPCDYEEDDDGEDDG